MSFRVYEMRRFCKDIPAVGISCILFDKQYLEQYKIGYNAAFRPMREALNIKPYDWYHDSNKILDKSSDIFILIEEEELIGSECRIIKECIHAFACGESNLGFSRFARCVLKLYGDVHGLGAVVLDGYALQLLWTIRRNGHSGHLACRCSLSSADICRVYDRLFQIG